MPGKPRILSLSLISFINSIKHEHSCISKIFNLLVDGSSAHCSKDCDCINHCVDGEIGLCNNNSCDCVSCEDDSNDGDSDSDAEDGGEF